MFAYRAIDFLCTDLPDASGTGVEEGCLLLVHIRRVVGQVRYRVCDACGRGVITAVVIDERFRGAGLGTRALSHLRSRHPGRTWTSPTTRHAALDLLRRTRMSAATSDAFCSMAVHQAGRQG
ncbi:GNAT family N-acetyltransferase [Streptomyces sp. NPDC004436]